MTDITDKQFSVSPLWVLILILVVYSFFSYRQSAIYAVKSDFFTLWAVPQALSSKAIKNIYSELGHNELASEMSRQAKLPKTSIKQKYVTSFSLNLYKGKIQTTATPFIYSLVGVLSTGDYEKDLMLFILTCSVCFLLSVIILCRLANYSFMASVLTISLLGSFYSPLHSDLLVGNINQIQLFILAMYIFCGRSERDIHILLSGTILSMGFMLKPNIFMVFVLSIIAVLINKEFKKLLWLLVGSSLGVIISFLFPVAYFGKLTIWVDFLKTLPKTLAFSFAVEQGNFSLSSLIFYLTGTDLSLVIAIGLISIFTYLKWRSRNTENSIKNDCKSIQDKQLSLRELFTVTGVGCGVVLFSAGLSWHHYYVLLIPLIIFVLRPTSENDPRGMSIILLRTLAFFALFLLTNIIDSLMSYTALLQQCILVNIASVMLVSLALYGLCFSKKYDFEKTLSKNDLT